MRRNNSRLWVVGLALAFFGCEGLTDLEVINENNPETQRALESPEDVEALIGGTFLTYWDGTQHSSPFAALSTASEEGTSSWGNFGMRDYSSEPRVVYNNSSSYGNRGTNNTPWNAMYAALSSTSDGITAINEGLKIGIDGGDNTRALAYAKFVQGLSLGWLALEFDKAIIFDENVDLAAAAAGEFEFEAYTAVMTAALVKLDAAIALAQSDNFQLRTGWINGITPTSAEFIKIIHSQKARMMAQVARTPAERTAVDWNAVLAEINAGITEDFVVTATADFTWWSRMTRHATDEGWVRADYKTIGWTDESGGYINWLATAPADREEFRLDTPDLRIWGCGSSGELGGQCVSVDGKLTRNARRGGKHGEAGDQEPGTVFRDYGPSPFNANRGTYHFSMYHHWLWEDVFQDNEGPMTYMQTEEMDLLKAEAYIRLGQDANAMAIINTTREAAGLATITSATGPGLQCPPVKLACTLMDQMMYEKRMETFYTAAGVSYFDRRGWGPLAASAPAHHQGLVEGTPLHLPVPGQELEVLQQQSYTFGGVGTEGSPPPSNMPSASFTARFADIYAFEPGMTFREKIEFIESNFRTRVGIELMTRYH